MVDINKNKLIDALSLDIIQQFRYLTTLHWMNMKWWFYDLMKENTNRSNLCMKNKCIGNLRRCTFSDYATNVHNVGYAHALLF